jgi:hypothetical protein
MGISFEKSNPLKKALYLLCCFIVKLSACIAIYAIGQIIVKKIAPIIFLDYGTGVYFLAFILGMLWILVHNFLHNAIKNFSEK